MAPKKHTPSGKTARQEYDQRRGTAQERGYTAEWGRESEAERLRIVAETGDFYCRYCRQNECTLMDHAIPPMSCGAPGSAAYIAMHRDRRLWIPCCKTCNDLKGGLTPDRLRVKRPEMYRRLVEELAMRGVPL